MKKRIQNITIKFLLGIAIVVGFWSCGEMFDDPTIDKDTGEDIQLLIVDFNFFTTRMNFKLVDNEDNASITKNARIWFSGTNANDIVNFAGEKRQDYSITEGQIELTVDPNVDITANSPFEYSVHVEVEGYETLSQGIQINSDGKKTFELFLSKALADEEVLTGTEDDDVFTFGMAQDGTKSALATEKSHKVGFTIKKSDILYFEGSNGKLFNSMDELEDAIEANPDGFIKLKVTKTAIYRTLTDRIIIDGISQMVSLTKLEKITITSLLVGGQYVTALNEGSIGSAATYLKTPQPDIFGFVDYSDNGAIFLGTEHAHKTVPSSDGFYVVKASSETLCAVGSTFNFTAGFKSSFSIDADIYDFEGKLIQTTNFKGKFPESFTMENVPSQSAKIVFRDNNPAFKAIDYLNVENLCNGSYTVEVAKAEQYEEYQIVLKALCEDNPSIAVAPTYSGEIRIKGSNDNWQGVDMIGGVVDILAKPNETYQIRLLWDDQWEYADFSTKFDTNGNYVNETDVNIKTEILEDGRTRLLIEHTFEQSICDDLDW